MCVSTLARHSDGVGLCGVSHHNRSVPSHGSQNEMLQARDESRHSSHKEER